MTSPTSSSSTSDVGQATALSINALIGGVKWGGVTGTGVALTYRLSAKEILSLRLICG